METVRIKTKKHISMGVKWKNIKIYGYKYNLPSNMNCICNQINVIVWLSKMLMLCPINQIFWMTRHKTCLIAHANCCTEMHFVCIKVSVEV